MPELDPNNLPVSPVPKAIEIIRAQLHGARGIRAKLNQSCKIATDAILADAINGKLQERDLPFIMLTYGTSADTMASNAGVILHRRVNINLFFVFYTGMKGGSVLPQRFTELRDRHIDATLEYLRDRQKPPAPITVGMTPEQHLDDSTPKRHVFWWWPDGLQDVHREHETPFDIFGVNLPGDPSSGKACSRVDIQIMVKNHATFNDNPPIILPGEPMITNFSMNGGGSDNFLMPLFPTLNFTKSNVGQVGSVTYFNVPGTISRQRIDIASAATGDNTFTLYVNGVAKSVQSTIASGNLTAGDILHSEHVNAGDWAATLFVGVDQSADMSIDYLFVPDA